MTNYKMELESNQLYVIFCSLNRKMKLKRKKTFDVLKSTMSELLNLVKVIK